MDLELDESSKSKSNSLSIRLTESAVFLSTNVGGRDSEQRSTLLRGLLILQLVKPTKIKSIDVELTATASSAWSEGDTLSKRTAFFCMLIIQI
jgi:arrestin-related trafficking adapter 3/6